MSHYILRNQGNKESSLDISASPTSGCQSTLSSALNITILLATALYLSVSISACGSAPNPPTHLSIPAQDNMAPGGAKVIAENDGVYELSVSDTASAPSVYATALKECGVPDQHSIASLSRQLFVGLEGIKINARERIILDGAPGFHMSAEAKLEGSPVGLISYSVKLGKCVVDIVFWQQGKLSDDVASLQNSNNKLKPIVSELLNSYRSGHAS